MRREIEHEHLLRYRADGFQPGDRVERGPHDEPFEIGDGEPEPQLDGATRAEVEPAADRRAVVGTHPHRPAAAAKIADQEGERFSLGDFPVGGFSRLVADLGLAGGYRRGKEHSTQNDTSHMVL